MSPQPAQGALEGSDDVSRMSWGARCHCLSPLCSAGNCAADTLTDVETQTCLHYRTFSKQTAVFWPCINRDATVTHKGRHRGDAARWLFYICGSTAGGFKRVGPPLRPCIHPDLYAKSCAHPVMTVQCAPLFHPSVYIWVGLARREAESVTSSVTTNACVGGRRGDQTPDLNQGCWSWVGGGGGHKDESGNCASAAVGLREHRQERSHSTSQPPPSPIPSVSLISRALPLLRSFGAPNRPLKAPAPSSSSSFCWNLSRTVLSFITSSLSLTTWCSPERRGPWQWEMCLVRPVKGYLRRLKRKERKPKIRFFTQTDTHTDTHICPEMT